jgi:hypothetical protein
LQHPPQMAQQFLRIRAVARQVPARHELRRLEPHTQYRYVISMPSALAAREKRYLWRLDRGHDASDLHRLLHAHSLRSVLSHGQSVRRQTHRRVGRRSAPVDAHGPQRGRRTRARHAATRPPHISSTIPRQDLARGELSDKTGSNLFKLYRSEVSWKSN